MKTERRHELHTNALADWLGLQIERFQPYARLAVGVLVAVIVAVGLYSYLQTQAGYRNEQGWQRYFTAMDDLQMKGAPEELTSLAESAEFANTPVGNRAVLSLADYHLREGIAQLFTDRAAATKSLRSAVDGYTRIVDRSKSPMLEEQAMLGVARAYESLNELDKARSAYEMLASKGSGPFANEAQARLRDLGRESTKRFYDWFFAASPPRQGLGGPGMPGIRPDFNTLPDERGFTPAATDSLLTTPKNPAAQPAEGTATEGAEAAPVDANAPAAPSTESPQADAAPPSDSPADNKPAEPAASDPKPE